jgi:hypothetical protein
MPGGVLATQIEAAPVTVIKATGKLIRAQGCGVVPKP